MKNHDEISHQSRTVFDAIKHLRNEIDVRLNFLKRPVYTLPMGAKTIVGNVGKHEVWWIPGWGVELVPRGTGSNGSLFSLVSYLDAYITTENVEFIPRSIQLIIDEVTKV